LCGAVVDELGRKAALGAGAVDAVPPLGSGKKGCELGKEREKGRRRLRLKEKKGGERERGKGKEGGKPEDHRGKRSWKKKKKKKG
jgi:hypothetical protein